jgi:hypothetical protein
VQTFDGEIFFDRSWFDADLVERFLVSQQHLSVRRGHGVLVALDPQASNQVGRWHEPHRLAVTRTELNRDNPGRHG